jgi:pilus assembly protein CpaB
MSKGIIPIIIAVALAALSAVLFWGIVENAKKSARAGWELTDVVVAGGNIAPGTILTADLITTDKLPRKFRTADMVIPKELDTVLGNEVVFPVQKGDPLSWHHLRGRETAEDRLSKAVTKKGRAITVSVNERSAVAGMVRPADHVDVLGVFRDPTDNRMIAVTLLQNIIVLATGTMRPMHRGTGGNTGKAHDYNSVTLLVLPAEAEILVLAQELGQLYFSLRNPEDLDIYQERARTTITTLITGERVTKLREERYQTIQRIKIIRGVPGLGMQ